MIDGCNLANEGVVVGFWEGITQSAVERDVSTSRYFEVGMHARHREVAVLYTLRVQVAV